MSPVDLLSAFSLLVAAFLVAAWIKRLASLAWNNREAIRRTLLYKRKRLPCPMCAGKGGYGAGGSEGELAFPCRKCEGTGLNPDAELVRRWGSLAWGGWRWRRGEKEVPKGDPHAAREATSIEEEMRKREEGI